MSESPWYASGLRFTCSGCGNCCRGRPDDPSYVWLSVPEGERLALHLGMEADVFFGRYVRRTGEELALVEKANGDCIFWEAGRGCTVYPARPTQCRTFPFWPENLKTKEAWARTCEGCRGAGQGRLYPAEELGAILRGRAETRAPGTSHACPGCAGGAHP